MNKRFPLRRLLAIAFWFSWDVANAGAVDRAARCAAWPTDESQLVDVLGATAVQAAGLSMQRTDGSRAELTKLVAPNAGFSLGSGDVGRPLGTGPIALAALMSELQADRFRFDGLNYMSRKLDPCASYTVTVEFSSQRLRHRAEVKFSFDQGKIVGGEGWLLGTTFGAFPSPSVAK